ncbi:hypothetical protein ACVXG7_10845 [Enterobacter hormaechei]
MGSCAAPSAKGDDKFITTDYLQQCRFIYSQRIPDLQETAAILLLLGGVLVTVHYHQLSRRGYAGNSPEVKGS